MISDNHNAYNNYNNYIDEYELTNGYAVVDRNFSIVTANEPMYLFLGMSKHYSIMDAIHQVDIDDFIDVANSLRPEIKKSMCIRMRRIDNSYRWVIVDIEKKVIPNTDSSEYLELHISDVLVIRELNKKLQQQIKAFKNETAENRNLLITQPEPAIKEFCLKNIEADNNCELSLIYLEVDNFEQFKATHTDDEFHRITYVIEDTILKAIDGRGLLGRLDDFKYIIAIKNINNEVKLRAFLEHIRTQISWHCKFIDSSYNIEFSIGIGRYPNNGKDLDLIKKKIQKAINIARSKGGNRYIIYKEFLHGEIEDSDK
jgi:GGDEF domain-containing protein